MRLVPCAPSSFPRHAHARTDRRRGNRRSPSRAACGARSRARTRLRYRPPDVCVPASTKFRGGLPSRARRCDLGKVVDDQVAARSRARACTLPRDRSVPGPRPRRDVVTTSRRAFVCRCRRSGTWRLTRQHERRRGWPGAPPTTDGTHPRPASCSSSRRGRRARRGRRSECAPGSAPSHVVAREALRAHVARLTPTRRDVRDRGCRGAPPTSSAGTRRRLRMRTSPREDSRRRGEARLEVTARSRARRRQGVRGDRRRAGLGRRSPPTVTKAPIGSWRRAERPGPGRRRSASSGCLGDYDLRRPSRDGRRRWRRFGVPRTGLTSREVFVVPEERMSATVAFPMVRAAAFTIGTDGASSVRACRPTPPSRNRTAGTHRYLGPGFVEKPWRREVEEDKPPMSGRITARRCVRQRARSHACGTARPDAQGRRAGARVFGTERTRGKLRIIAAALARPTRRTIQHRGAGAEPSSSFGQARRRPIASVRGRARERDDRSRARSTCGHRGQVEREGLPLGETVVTREPDRVAVVDLSS